ncbi:MAG: type II secretion system ATPase GspE [Deltaproteobacteria bacterium]|nr:type II secretion system ATPase GspE [Deltaproteobacteria bacterium]
MGIRRAGLEDLLRQRGVEPRLVAQVKAAADKAGQSFAEAALGMIDAETLVKALGEFTGLPVLRDVDPDAIDPELVRQIRHSIAEENGIFPLYRAEGQVVVALSSLKGLGVLDDLRMVIGEPLRPVLLPSDRFKELITTAYEKARESASSVLEDAENEESEEEFSLEDADLMDDSSDAVIIRFVNAVLSEAIKERASDIHIEPFEKDLVVRFRVDGVLHERHRPPARFKSSIVSRIKIMAGLNIAEKRLPQDGRIRKKMGGREIDMRISTVPVRHGERVVMRLLEKGGVFSLDGTGMQGPLLAQFRELIRQPHGIVLVCGPTGSGKSTTLYSAISEINSPDKNILTVEDPVEYELHGIGQVQVNSRIDLTFASALRSFLRQDPDVILVGEVRDRETAENAVQASLTGHLVFSTIHTNDSAGAFTRLVEMGIEPFLVADSILGILAQRLMRRLCPVCKAEYTPSDTDLRELGVARHDFLTLTGGRGTAWKPVGCKECGNYGYKGRVGIFELLTATDELKQAVVANREPGSIKKLAVAHGMIPLRDDGLRQVAAGVTSFQEVLRVTREDSE